MITLSVVFVRKLEWLPRRTLSSDVVRTRTSRFDDAARGQPQRCCPLACSSTALPLDVDARRPPVPDRASFVHNLFFLFFTLCRCYYYYVLFFFLPVVFRATISRRLRPCNARVHSSCLY